MKKISYVLAALATIAIAAPAVAQDKDKPMAKEGMHEGMHEGKGMHHSMHHRMGMETHRHHHMRHMMKKEGM